MVLILLSPGNLRTKRKTAKPENKSGRKTKKVKSTTIKIILGDVTFPSSSECFDWWGFDLNEDNLRYGVESSIKKGEITNELGLLFITLADRFSDTQNYRLYSSDYLEDMKNNAVLSMCECYSKYDIRKNTKPFAYFTMVTQNAFIRTLQVRRRQDAIFR